MKQLKLFFYTLLTAFAFTACGGDENGDITDIPTPPPTVDASNVNANPKTNPFYRRTEFPKIKEDDNNLVLVHRTADTYDKDGVNYAVEWDIDKKAQRWTAYQMHKGYGGSAGYYGSFTEDPDLPTYARFSSTNSMYSGSGFTRGHICPSADRQYSTTANIQTFYYTNMQPQYYNFNAGKNYTGEWVKMEDRLRTWTNRLDASDTIFVVKGGTIDNEKDIIMRVNGNRTVSTGGLIVPKYFFVALLKRTSSGYSRALAFWFEHTNTIKSNVNLSEYVISVRQLENRTGIDFFCNLPDLVEEAVETANISDIKNDWGL